MSGGWWLGPFRGGVVNTDDAIEYNYVTGDRIIFTALEQFSAHLGGGVGAALLFSPLYRGGCDNLIYYFRGGGMPTIYFAVMTSSVILLHRAGATFPSLWDCAPV